MTDRTDEGRRRRHIELVDPVEPDPEVDPELLLALAAFEADEPEAGPLRAGPARVDAIEAQWEAMDRAQEHASGSHRWRNAGLIFAAAAALVLGVQTLAPESPTAAPAYELVHVPIMRGGAAPSVELGSEPIEIVRADGQKTTLMLKPLRHPGWRFGALFLRVGGRMAALDVNVQSRVGGEIEIELDHASVPDWSELLTGEPAHLLVTVGPPGETPLTVEVLRADHGGGCSGSEPRYEVHPQPISVSRVGADEPLYFQVGFAGCRRVLEGRVCEVSPGDEVTLWVETQPATQLFITVDGVERDPDTAARAEGRRFVLRDVAGKQGLEVRAALAGTVRRWSMSLREPNVWPGESKYRAVVSEGDGATRAAAAEELDAQLPLSVEEWQAPAWHYRGLLAKRLGRLDEAEGFFRQARDAALAHGVISDAVRSTLAWSRLVALERARPDEGIARLAEISGRVGGATRLDARLAYYRAIILDPWGDLHGALDAYDDAELLAWGAAHAGTQADVREGRALLLAHLGRTEEARAELLEPRPDEDLWSKRQRATNLAWIQFVHREANAHSLEDPAWDPTPWLDVAIAGWTDDQGHPKDRGRLAELHVTRALAALQTDGLSEAQEALESSRRALPEPGELVQIWRLDADTRLALALGDLERAEAQVAALRDVARHSGSLDGRWSAWVLTGRVRARLGDEAGAEAAYREAERDLDTLASGLPRAEGRESWLGDHQRSGVALVELLLGQDRADEAFEVARQVRRRAMAQVARRHIVGRASPAWSPGQGRRAVAPPEPADSLAPGEVRLLLHPRPGGWWAFVQDAQETRAHALGPSPGGAEAGQPDAWARWLLGPLEETLHGAERLTVLASGPLAGLDVHALRYRGRPLVDHLPVAYAVDALTQPVTGGDGALVVVDSLSGSAPLPGARRTEARLLALSALPVVTLAGAAATRGAVVDQLERSSFAHFGVHGYAEPGASWRGGLAMADGRLTPGDVLLAARVPEQVVLSACSSAPRTEEPSVVGMSLANAFVVAGSSQVIGTRRDVLDTTATAVTRALYDHVAPGDLVDAPSALRTAQLAVRSRLPDADWAAYRAIVP